MPQSLAKIYLHICFSTKYREKTIDELIEKDLHKYLGGICKGMECYPVEIGGYQDHVHVLCMLSRKVTVAELLEELKKRSSKWVKTIDNKYSNFYWQHGYGVFSVSEAQVENVRKYIQNQHIHHAKCDFKTEYRELLIKHGVEFDERYVWD